MNLVKLGSETAKGGFKNERDVADKFCHWKNDCDAQRWLTILGEDPSKIDNVVSSTLGNGQKPDIFVKVTSENYTRTHYISIKKANMNSNFNQVDKRWVDNYIELWNIPSNTARLLKMFCGEIRPEESLNNGWISQQQYSSLIDKRRMFLNEFKYNERQEILDFFSNNKSQIISDLVKGRAPNEAGWVMVTCYNTHNDTTSWKLVDIDSAIKAFSTGAVVMTKQGNMAIGQVTLQRKGGDGGRKTANMLQFKIKPLILFDA